MTNKPTPASQPSPRMIPDTECAQGKCACNTTGCWGVCSLKRSSAPVVVQTPLAPGVVYVRSEQPSPARSDKDAAREEGWDAALAAAEKAIRDRAHSDEIFVENAVDELRGLWRGGYVAERAPSGELDIEAEREAFVKAYLAEYPHRFVNDAEAMFDMSAGRMWLAARRATAGTTAALSKLQARLMEMSEVLRAGGTWDGNEFIYADKTESDIAMLDDLLTDVLRLAGNAAPTEIEKLERYTVVGTILGIPRRELLTVVLLDDVQALLASNTATAAPGDLPPLPEQQSSGAVYGIIDPDYGRIYTMVRKLAWEEGYAIGLHGSFTRDLDMIAVPWDDNRNCKPEKLVARIKQATGLTEAHGNPGIKPHGRKVWTLLLPEFGDPRFVDLSIMPTLAAPSNPPVGAAQEKE